MHVHIWQSWIKENVTNMSAKKVNVEVYIDCKRISALLSRMNTLSHFFFFFSISERSCSKWRIVHG